jgi:hypothetical protein
MGKVTETPEGGKDLGEYRPGHSPTEGLFGNKT